MGKRGIGIEIGTTGMRIVCGQRKGDAFEVDQVMRFAFPVGASDPVSAVADALASNGKLKLKSGRALAGLTGRDLMIRYSQVPPVPDWQLRQMMGFEIQEIRSRSNEAVATDFNLLPSVSELTADDTVLLAVAKEALLTTVDESLASARLKPTGYVPNSVAVFNAFAKLGPATEGTTLLLNLGAKNSDVAILRGTDLIFARNISTGSDVFNDALMAQFNVKYEKAEKLKLEMANAAPRDQRKNLSPQEEKVALAIEGAVGQIFALIQSTLMYCKSSLKLQDISPDRLYITGGGSRLKGLDRYLGAQFGVPVEVFNPLPEVATGEASELAEQLGPDATAALGLAIMACSTDTYSLEIVPESVRKKREFARRHGFSIAAVALVLAFLGFDFYTSQQNYAQIQQERKLIGAELNLRKDNKRKFDRELATREELAAKIAQLEERNEATLGLARAQAIVQKHLPEEMWVRRIYLDLADVKDQPALGKRSVVVVEGAGKESAKENLVAAYSRFEKAVAGEPDVGEDNILSQPSTSGEFKFKLTISFTHVAKPEDAGAKGAADKEQARVSATAENVKASATMSGSERKGRDSQPK
ncbi:MAG: pilus assembly protein PilM [Planctomycetota bacterium]